MNKLLQSASSYESFTPNLFNFESDDFGLKRYVLQELVRSRVEYDSTNILSFNDGYISDLCTIYNSSRILILESTVDMDHSKLDFDIVLEHQKCSISFVEIDALFIFKAGKNNYGHLLVEMLPKIELACRHGLFDKFTLVLPTLPEPLRLIVLEVIDIFSNYYNVRILTYTLTSALTQFKSVNFITAISQHNKKKSAVIVDFIDILITHYEKSKYRNGTPEKLYLYRPAGHVRSIINQDQIHQVALDCGFTPLDMSGVPFKDQIMRVRTATHIVGDHGAALTNMVFAESDCKIGMIDPGLYDFFFWDLACIKRQNFNWYFNDLKMWSLEFSQAPYRVNPKTLSCFFDSVASM